MNKAIYKDRYTVFESGEIFGVHGKKLKDRITQFGYSKVAIYSGGCCKGEFKHRIIAICFIPNPEQKPQVNHIDGNRLNNCVDNLEWVTNIENQRHSWASGKRSVSEKAMESCRRMGKNHGSTTGYAMGKRYGPANAAKKVINMSTGEIYVSASAAAKSIGVKPQTLRSWLTNSRTNKTQLTYI